MIQRLDRIDRYVARLVIVDATHGPAPEPEPGTMRATMTDEGYLLAEGYTARDGLLEYSDGTDTWTEYRPRSELIAAAASWKVAPLTDDHPTAMVDATTWVKVARGVAVDDATVTDPNLAGISFLRQRLLFTDAALIKRIQDGSQAELSIGFTSLVVPTQDGVAPDGTPAHAVQTEMVGNHVAAVSEGRAGPQVRVLLDGAAQTVYNVKDFMPMPIRTPKPGARADEAGGPVEAVEITGPDGVAVSVPTWVAAMLQELQQLRAQSAPVAPPADPMAAPVAPPVADAPVPPPAPAPAAAPAPEDEPEDSKDKSDEEKDDPSMDSAAVQTLVRRRARLERLALTAGVDPVHFDSADDVLAKAYVAQRIPTAKLDSLTALQLDALVDVAASLPAPEPAPADRADARPWMLDRVAVTDSADSPDDEAEAAYLTAQGY
jgi:hypothetical protein